MSIASTDRAARLPSPSSIAIEHYGVEVGTGPNAGDTAGCRTATAAARDASQTFLTGLGTVTAPASEQQSDSALRQALALLISGSNMEVKGMDDYSTSEVEAGASVVSQGDQLLPPAG